MKVDGAYTYIGDFVNDQKHGNGTIYWNDGSTYEGEFQRNRIHGFGRLTPKNGAVIEGVWKKNALASKQYSKGFF